jgi:hypothetical protein
MGKSLVSKTLEEGPKGAWFFADVGWYQIPQGFRQIRSL